MNGTTPHASTGFAPLFLVQTTGSSRQRASFWASPPRAPGGRRFWWPAWRASWLARSRWPAGEYVSVSSQADTERADLARERSELATDLAAEEQELAAIYIRRGLEPALARTVAQQLMAHDALGAHARDELGLSDDLTARPVQAALASAATVAVGAALPILPVLLVPPNFLEFVVAGASLMCLAALGALAGRVGGASMIVGAVRVTVWGALAMAITAGVGALFGTTIG